MTFTDPTDRARFLTGPARQEAIENLSEDELWFVWQRAISHNLKNALRDEFGRRAPQTQR